MLSIESQDETFLPTKKNSKNDTHKIYQNQDR